MTDKRVLWGLPVLAMDVSMRENELAMRKDMGADAAEMLEAAGVRDVRVHDDDYAPGMGIHEMGTARMGRDRRTSVLNQHNQVWDAPNVYVTDGACMTSSACVNPSLTYMALTARAADHAVREDRLVVFDERDDVHRHVFGRDDRDLVGIDTDVPQDERQDPLADAAETEDAQGAATHGGQRGQAPVGVLDPQARQLLGRGKHQGQGEFGHLLGIGAAAEQARGHAEAADMALELPSDDFAYTGGLQARPSGDQVVDADDWLRTAGLETAPASSPAVPPPLPEVPVSPSTCVSMWKPAFMPPPHRCWVMQQGLQCIGRSAPISSFPTRCAQALRCCGSACFLRSVR